MLVTVLMKKAPVALTLSPVHPLLEASPHRMVTVAVATKVIVKCQTSKVQAVESNHHPVPLKSNLKRNKKTQNRWEN